MVWRDSMAQTQRCSSAALPTWPSQFKIWDLVIPTLFASTRLVAQGFKWGICTATLMDKQTLGQSLMIRMKGISAATSPSTLLEVSGYHKGGLNYQLNFMCCNRESHSRPPDNMRWGREDCSDRACCPHYGCHHPNPVGSRGCCNIRWTNWLQAALRHVHPQEYPSNCLTENPGVRGENLWNPIHARVELSHY